MADENFEALQAIAENDNAKSSNDKSYPFFLDAAEKIPFELQGFVADYKRKINYELTPDNLLWAVGEEVSNFEIRKGLIMPVLKMRLEENQAPVYVFANQVGSNYPHLDSFKAKNLYERGADFRGISLDTTPLKELLLKLSLDVLFKS